MRLLLDNLPVPLKSQHAVLAECLAAFDRVRHIHQVYLFGSFARGTPEQGSDVDLCIVADGAEAQIPTAREFRHAIRTIRPKPALTLIPITPTRLNEKRASGDHFFATVLNEGVLLATED